MTLIGPLDVALGLVLALLGRPTAPWATVSWLVALAADLRLGPVPSPAGSGAGE